MTEAMIRLPPKLVPIFSKPRGAVQYRGAYGGRGSGKSFNFAKMAAVWGYAEPLRVLCTREFQASIKESFHAELKAAIASEPWLEAHYDVGIDYLRGSNGTEFIFRGLRHGVSSIKSLAKIDLTIVEEAEDVPEVSWLALEATVFRQPRSELWPIWNPRLDGSPVDLRFRKNAPANAIVTEMNWNDNPFFPVGLETLRKREQERLDPNTYAHVWEGAYLENSNAQVFAGKYRIAEFELKTNWDGPYQGGDFGFAQDPTAAIRCWINDDVLYISHEAGRVGLELDDTSPFILRHISGFDQYATRWDNARPESISHLKRHGLPRSEPVDKWKGSVEDGIAFLRSFREIVVHPRCVETIKEMRLYSYKVDRLTGDVLPTLVDANNHYIDALRYAVSPMIKRGPSASIFLTKRHR
ncbi:phage terminase large subunit [Ochrobactrum sp. Marseille-Q0166]|uniref:PBSX family phage terminase large subunit n=1 Tax=Ochrobactrum sp. Marseille-Q0166 TaxID=2761105 RepID=UPI001655F9B7|nr:phage terminase large subunit [Ochrobactrum sp. Marseille-Q0166]MBC8718814.1 PBSX family phage terminase large subunit [Ochrobactrum sp. Marseille-Q0166]